MADHAEDLLDELLTLWRSDGASPGDAQPAPARSGMYAPAGPASPPATSVATLGAELGQRLVSEILNGVRAGRQGVFVSEPERLRMAIFLRGYSLGDFARRADIAPSTLSRALAGQPIAPNSWRALISTLDSG